MKRTLTLIAFATLLSQPFVATADKSPVTAKLYPDVITALKYNADPKRGQAAFRVCRGCHLEDGSGRGKSEIPQLAGQHDTVLIKQVLDVKAGRRHNPKMHPFTDEMLVGTEDIADIAAYLSVLPLPANNQVGDGKNLAHGKKLYERDCASCHGAKGEGQAARFYPLVAGQHYAYLKRESIESRDEGRRNGDAEMVRVLKSYSNADIEAVSDYMSRLRGE